MEVHKTNEKILIWMHRDVVCLEVVLANGLSELHIPKTVCVMGMTIFQSVADGLVDALRYVKIGLTHLQMDDMHPLSLQCIGPLKDIHDEKGRDLFCPTYDHFVCSFYSALPRFGSFPLDVFDPFCSDNTPTRSIPNLCATLTG